MQARLGRDLIEYLDAAVKDGRDWRSIGADVSAASGVQVSYESLRRWHERATLTRGSAA